MDGLRVEKRTYGNLADNMYQGSGEYFYFIQDHLGSVRLVVVSSNDTVQLVVESYGYSLYGEVVSSSVSGDAPSEIKYTGHEEENEGLQGIYYAGARFYRSAAEIPRCRTMPALGGGIPPIR